MSGSDEPIDPVAPVEVEASEAAGAEEALDGDLPARRSLPSWPGVLAWTAFALTAVLLDGPYGGVVPVIVAAVLLARLPMRVIGGIGVVAIGLVPFSLLLQGVPRPDEISPRFVVDAMAAHHLAFGGLLLVGTWAVLDMWPAMRSTARGAREVPPPAVDEPARPELGIAILIVALVAAIMVMACAAVLGA